jgi:hypothetical protein
MRRYALGLVVLTGGCRGAAIEVVYLDDSTGVATTITTSTDGVDSTGGAEDSPSPTTDSPPTSWCPEVRVIEAGVSSVRVYDTADLTGDGIDELLAVDVFPFNPQINTTGVQVLRPQGELFVPSVLTMQVTGGYVGFHDIEGDGWRDLVVREPDGPAGYPFKYYRLETAPEYALAAGPTEIFSPPEQVATFLDLDDDGISDVLGASLDGDVQTVFIGLGNADFTPRSTQDYPGALQLDGFDARAPGWFATVAQGFGDFSCDPGWVATTQLQVGGAAVASVLGPVSTHDRVLDVVDVDGNGWPDVYARRCDVPGSTFGVDLLQAYPDGMGPTWSQAGLAWVETADIDGDGEVDVVYAEPSTGTVTVQFMVGGLPAQIVVGASLDPRTQAVGHARLFDTAGEQVLVAIPDAVGTTWAVITGAPC